MSMVQRLEQPQPQPMMLERQSEYVSPLDLSVLLRTMTLMKRASARHRNWTPTPLLRADI